MHTTLDLKNKLRQSLLRYKNKHPHLSIRAIAKKSGVNRYFINKLLDEKDQTQSLDLNQVLILSKYITQRHSIKEVINASEKSIKNILQDIFIEGQLENKKIDADDRYVYFILVLAAYGLGTKRDYVSKIFGEMGEKALDELLIQEVLVEASGRIRLRVATDLTFDIKLVLKRIPDYLNFYRLERRVKGENYLHLLSEGLNKKALQKIQKIHVSAYKQIAKVMTNKDSLGDIPVFSFACMDRLLDNIKEKNGT